MYIDLQNPNPMSISVDCDWNTFIIRIFPLLLRGSLVAGCDGTLSAPSALHVVPRCVQSSLSRRPKLTIGSEKLIHSTLFAAGGNNSLELIYHWTVEVEFFFILKLPIIQKFSVTRDCRGFPVPTDESGHLIWIFFQVKTQSFEEKYLFWTFSNYVLR